MDFVIMLAKAPTGLWPTLISWFENFVGSYGWAIILFTVCLKLVLSPLDFLQKASMRKTQRQQALLKPELDRIKEKYGNNKDMVNQKTMELYSKNKINPAGGCLPMLISLVTTMVVFFTLFSSMNQISQFKIQDEYEKLSATYVESKAYYDANFVSGSDITITTKDGIYTFDQVVANAKQEFNDNQQDGSYTVGDITYTSAEDYADAEIEAARVLLAEQKVLDNYNEIRESWLWVKNIYRPDNYSASFPNYNEFIQMTGNFYSEKTIEGTDQKYYYKSIDETAGTDGYFYLTEDKEENKNILQQAKAQGQIDFTTVTGIVRQKYNSWNGYFILILLAGFSTLLGQLFANLGAKAKLKNGEEVQVKQETNKIMLFVLPVIMIWFTWSYSTLFALYIVVNSLMSVLIGYIVNIIVNKVDVRAEKKELQKISLKETTPRVNKTVVSSEIANADYKIEKKSKIIETKPDKKK